MRVVAGQEVFFDGTVWKWSFPVPSTYPAYKDPDEAEYRRLAELLSPVRRELNWYRRRTVEQVRRDNPDNPLIKPGPVAPPATDFSFPKPVYTNNVEQWDHSNLKEWIGEHYHQDQKGAWHPGGVPDGRRSR